MLWKEALLCECIVPKSYQSYQNSIDKHDYTFMLHKKVSIATITKKAAYKHSSKRIYSMLVKLQFSLLYGLITRQYYRK